jgi:hypothetical protein
MSGSLITGVLPPVADDGDLDSMLTEMQDVSMSRTTARRDGGVEEISPNRNDPSMGQDSPGTWSGARQGTSESVWEESVYGRPETVISEGRSVSTPVPSLVALKAGTSRSSTMSTGKKYKLVRLPTEDEKGYNELCLGLIGHGTTFCTARRCPTTHQGTVLSVSPGDLYVAKTATTAFADPKSHYLRLTPELWSDWDNLACSLEEWSRLFMLVNNDTDAAPATFAELEARAHFASQAEAHRTPGKRKFSHEEAPTLVDSTYRRQMSTKEGDAENPFILDSEAALKFLKNMDHGLEKTSGKILKMTMNQSEEAKEHNLASRSLEHRLEKLVREVGSKPQALDVEINTPTVWGSIGALGEKLDVVTDSKKKNHAMNVAKQVSMEVSREVPLEVSRLIDPFKVTMVDSFTERSTALEERINTLKSFIIRSTKHMNYKIESEVSNLGWNDSGKAVGALSDTVKPDWFLDVMKSMEGKICKVSEGLARITAENDDQAIRFGGLGFRTSKESNAWLVTHMPEHHCGMLVDVHIVMEHVQSSITGTDTINMLEKLFKLKLQTLADGMAMKSYERKIPRFFSSASAHKVIKHDDSHFDNIASYEEWDTPVSGFRARLKEELVTCRAAHLGNIDETLERDSIGYAIATMALTEAIGWMEGFIVFLDDYYRDLSKARFGTKKAWHVTTRLGRRMLLELSMPRNGVQHSFSPGKNDQICQRIVWSVLKCHDIMARYKRHSYKDDPTVGSELVKFLAVNSGFEVLDSLKVDMAAVKVDLATVKKDVNAAIKASGAAANKADEGKKVQDALIKRVMKLEK